MSMAADWRQDGVRATRGAVIVALALAAAGCARQPEPTPLQAGAINTGTYPNLNVPPPIAATQLSAQDQATQRSELAAARARQAAAGAGGAGASAADRQRLLRAQATQEETLRTITGQP